VKRSTIIGLAVVLVLGAASVAILQLANQSAPASQLVRAGTVTCDPNVGPNLLDPDHPNLTVSMSSEGPGTTEYYYVNQTICDGHDAFFEAHWLQYTLHGQSVDVTWYAPVRTQWQKVCAFTPLDNDSHCVGLLPNQTSYAWPLEQGEALEGLYVTGQSDELPPSVDPSTTISGGVVAGTPFYNI